jgi:hypothetical protein
MLQTAGKKEAHMYVEAFLYSTIRDASSISIEESTIWMIRNMVRANCVTISALSITGVSELLGGFQFLEFSMRLSADSSGP